MTSSQGEVLIQRSRLLTAQWQTSTKYQTQVRGQYLVYILAVYVCLLVLVAARPLWKGKRA